MRGLAVPTLLLFTDTAVTVTSTLLAYVLRATLLPDFFGFDPFSPVQSYMSLWPALVVLLLLRAAFGLYPGYGLHPAEELRRQTLASALVLFFVLAGGALFQFNTVFSRVVLILTGFFLFLTLPTARALVKGLLARTPFYGSPIWIIGQSERAAELETLLNEHPAIGLKVAGRGDAGPADPERVNHCLVVPETLPGQSLSALLDTLNQTYRHVWLAPNMLDVASVWVTPRDLNGHLTLELRNNLLEPRNRILKRVTDVLLTVLLGVCCAPLAALIYLWIRLDSPGPGLLRQTRVGQDGATFTTYKFRTMHRDAKRHLEAYLRADESAKHEWQATRKLRRDPRVTRAGRFLRRSSLDELPQIINILRGDMSLVGPRPIMEDELAWYGDKSHLYLQVRPGLTGLMQVSGRSELSYPERVRLDAYYVRNWSTWLDLVILARTLTAVISGKGAF